MKKKAAALKRVDSNTVIQEKSQTVRWFDYQCMLTGSLKPMNEIGIKRLGYEIKSWAFHDSKALRLSQFYHKMGISGMTWRRWCREFPSLQEDSDAAKEMIGERRELGALNHEYNTAIVAYTMPFYDAEWKDETVRRAALKESSSEGKSSIAVTMYAIPNSDLVPEKKSDETKD